MSQLVYPEGLTSGTECGRTSASQSQGTAVTGQMGTIAVTGNPVVFIGFSLYFAGEGKQATQEGISQICPQKMDCSAFFSVCRLAGEPAVLTHFPFAQQLSLTLVLLPQVDGWLGQLIGCRL